MHKKFRRPPPHVDEWIVGALFAIGVLAATVIPGNIYRGWFALAALILSLAFVLVYSRRNWRSTFGGKASMLSMVITVIYTANVVAILWYPFQNEQGTQYGYPYWEDATEVIYLLLALAALYKFMTLMRAGKPDEDGDLDPTVQYPDE